MLNKYTIGFTDTDMGCNSLGWIPREGRDRVEEMRHYKGHLDSLGYVVTELGRDFVRLQLDDSGNIHRKP